MRRISDIFRVSKDKGVSLFHNDGLLSTKSKFNLLETEEKVLHTNEKVLFFAEFDMKNEPGAASILKFTNLKKLRSLPSEEFLLYLYITTKRLVFLVKGESGTFHASNFTPKEEAFHELQFYWEKSKFKKDDWKVYLVVKVRGFYKPVILGCATNKSLQYCKKAFNHAYSLLGESYIKKHH